MSGVFQLIVGVFFAGAVFGSAQGVHLETYGDSLTAGFLANTSLTQPPALEELSKILGNLAFGFLQKDRELLRKFEATDKAWPSFFSEELRAHGKHILSVNNFAVSGSRSAALLDQVNQEGQSSGPTWAFFFIGHNDLCHVKGDETALVTQYRANLNQALDEWEKKHTESTVFLIPTSPIHQLYPVLEDFVWLENEQKSFKCQDSWTKYFPYCTSFYIRYKKGELESYLKPRGEAINESLKEIAQQRNLKSENQNRFFYLEAQWPFPLKPEYFAMDCYHIAEPGQKIFAHNITEAILKLLPQSETLR
jgi:lysophospholipase L1-like esterase